MTKRAQGALSTAAMAVTATALAVVACGRSEPAKSPHAEESSMAPAAARADAEMPKDQVTAAPPSPPSQAPASQASPEAKKEDVDRAASGAPRGPSPDERGASLRRARSDFDRASRDVSVYANDCPLACRALASMDRAASHLCLLAESDDDRAQCDDARARTEAARRRVRATCGVCAAAPVPSP